MAHRELPDLRTNLTVDGQHIIPVSEGGRAAPLVEREPVEFRTGMRTEGTGLLSDHWRALMPTLEDLDKLQASLDRARQKVLAEQAKQAGDHLD